MGLCRFWVRGLTPSVSFEFSDFFKITTIIVIFLTLSGCGGGRSGTNSGGNLKFGVVFDYRNPADDTPVAGVITTFADQENRSGEDGSAAFTVTSINTELIFEVNFEGVTEVLNLETPAAYDLERNQGIYVIVDVTDDQSSDKAEIKLREIIPVPKGKDVTREEEREDPVIEEQNFDSSEDKDEKVNDHPKPNATPGATPLATPTPEPTPDVSALTAIVEGVVVDPQGDPIPDVGVHVGLQGLDQRLFTGPDGTFEFRRAPIYQRRAENITADTVDRGFLHLRVGGRDIDIAVSPSYSRDNQKYALTIVLTEGQIDFVSHVVPRNKKAPSADIDTGGGTEGPKPTTPPNASPDADLADSPSNDIASPNGADLIATPGMGG